MSDPIGVLPEWAVAELRRPVATSAAQRQRIMELVRVRALRGAPVARPADRTGAGVGGRSGARTLMLSRSGLRSGIALAALAAGIAAFIWSGSFLRSSGPASTVFTGMTAGQAIVIGDTIDSALHDTLRLVRFVLDAPAAARVALAGDFNEWSRTATPLDSGAVGGAWSVVVAIQPGRRHHAFVVDDTQWVSAPAPSYGRGVGVRGSRGAPTRGDST